MNSIEIEPQVSYEDIDSNNDELEQAMLEACKGFEQDHQIAGYATCELTSQGYRICVTPEPQTI